MRIHAILLLTTLLLAALAALTGANAPESDAAGRFLGGWVNDEYNLYIRRDDDGIAGRLSQAEGDRAWEFSGGYYDADKARLYFLNCIRYREYIDLDTLELVQEDWSMSDLVFTWLALAGDGDALTAGDIPGIEAPLALRRVSDEEYFGF